MEEQHERLFDLIASKSFEELSKDEQSFVLGHLTEAEYSLQRTVIAASAELEYDTEEPLALELPAPKKPFLKRSIPLYQVLIGAACLVLLFMAANTKTYSLNWNFSRYPLEISIANGASSGKVIHDTVVKEIPVLQSGSKIIRDTVTIVQNSIQQTEKRMLEAGNSVPYPELSEKLLESKSVSLKDDQTAQFLPAVNAIGTMK
jgi:hypothetical protein